MKKVGININSSKDADGSILRRIERKIKSIQSSIEIITYKDSKGLDDEETKNLDIIIVLGGDGTILSTGRIVAKYGIPIFGVNIGHLGFLTEVESSEVDIAIKKIFEGEYSVEERSMLQCEIDDTGKIITALNDIVLSKGTLARIVKYGIYVDDKLYTNFMGDGVVVSTPTGSTAYSLSAGGPIIYPTLDIIGITPICPHSLGVRTLILNSNSVITVSVCESFEKVFVTIDGQESVELLDNGSVKVSKAPYKCKIIKLKEYDYFKILRKKITYRSRECEDDNV